MDNEYICKCGKTAVWMYMPGREEDVACDDCVPRGCSCNMEPIDENWENGNPDNWKEPTDVLGRKYPCYEWEMI